MTDHPTHVVLDQTPAVLRVVAREDGANRFPAPSRHTYRAAGRIAPLGPTIDSEGFWRAHAFS